MSDKKLEQICLIEEELLSNPNVNAQTILFAGNLAEEDNYLYELMIDFAKEVPGESKSMMMEEIINYSEEMMRKLDIKNDRY